jgi:hypothetical protein
MPLVFYGILEKWNLTTFLKKVISATFGALFGILFSLFLLLFQLSHLNSQKINGWNYILETFSRRSYDNPDKYIDPIYNQSMRSSVWDVLFTYFKGNEFVFKYHNLNLTVSFFQCICILLIVTIFILIKYKTQKTLALITTLWISILAPISWFVIFKSHSFIHTHMNFIVWYMPFMLLGYVLIGNCATTFLNKKS